MPERIKTPNGGYYVEKSLGKYMYYDDPNGLYGIIKSKEEIEEIKNMWDWKKWSIYYTIVIICIAVLITVLVVVSLSKTLQIMMYVLVGIAGAAFIIPWFKEV